MSQRRPNILFLFTDQQRPDWLGSRRDIPVRTSNIDALGDRGVRFTDAVCPSPVCNPSRAALASGMEYDRCGVPGNDVDYPTGELTTYFERLRDEAGYHVMGCGKFDLASDFPLGMNGDEGVERWGFSEARFNRPKCNTAFSVRDSDGTPTDPYTTYLATQGLLDDHVEDYTERWSDDVWTATSPTPLPQEAYYDDWITRQGLDMLEGAPDDEPWFLQVNFQNPHHPWDVTSEMHDWYRNPDVEFPLPAHSSLDVDAETHQEIRRNYAAMIEHIDRCVGRFVEMLEKMGVREDTLIVFSSDHGEMLGDYGQWQKLSPLQPSIGVPLVVDGPGVESMGTCNWPATILDLHATFLEVAGLARSDEIDSRSMWPFLSGTERLPRDVVYSGLGAWRLAYDGRFKYIEGYDPEKRHRNEYEPMIIDDETARKRREERERFLFDVPAGEHENVAEEHPAVVDRLSNSLADTVQQP